MSELDQVVKKPAALMMKAGETIMSTIGDITNIDPGTRFVELIILILIGLIVCLFIFWAFSLTSLQYNDCSKLDNIYAKNDKHIHPIATYNPYNYSSSISQYKPANYMFDSSGGNARVFSYYIKTAYNCCSPGNFTNSFVSLCALRHVIALGARCLDFEIYSLNTEPIVATSSQASTLVSSFFIKETFNSLKLSDVLNYIKYFALEDSNGGATNYSDPLFLHFRIMTSQEETINLIAKYLTDILGNHLLGATYGQNNNGVSLSRNALLTFCGKCVIMINDNTMNSNIIMASDLWPLTNILTGSDNYRLYRYSSISSMNDTDIDDLTIYNKYNVSMILPDAGYETNNFDSRICLKTGCQFIAMNFQTFDANLETYFSVFGETGYSYVLKPCSLRWVPVHYLINYKDLSAPGAGCQQVSTSADGTITATGGPSS